ncbi:MAG TPA: hypothetical protein PK095_18335 [Myxococcota bacterium]|nr:hypothetical protein [Myxococcota bacterium]
MDIIAVRRDLWRLRLIDRALLVTNLGFVAAVIVTVFILRHLDQVYVLMTLYGSLSSVLRFFVWKVRAVPTPLLTLAHGTPDQRDAAWRLITEHRDELLSATTLPATIHEPALSELDRDGLVERVKRHGTTNWRRLFRVLMTVWLVGLAVVLVAVSQHTPAAEVDAQNVRGGAKPLRW